MNSPRSILMRGGGPVARVRLALAHEEDLRAAERRSVGLTEYVFKLCC